MIQNLHTHTTFCDGRSTPEEMVCSAVALGIHSLGFSGHAPMEGQNDSWTMVQEDVPRYRAEVLRLREKYAEELEIFLGLEQDYDSPPLTDGWDYVIGSVHQVRRNGCWVPIDESKEVFARNVVEHYGGDCYTLVEDYYRLVGGIPERTGCQIVGHFDLITKFNRENEFFDTGHPRYKAAVLEALDRLSAQDVICEINTGAMARGYRSEPYPAPWILRAMRERRVPICITSDAHSAGALLYAFPQAVELAGNCGYREQMALTKQGFVPVKLECSGIYY